MLAGSDGIHRPVPGHLAKALRSLPELSHPDIPQYDLLEWETIMDSSDFSPACWVKLAKQIEENYYKYDGCAFVVCFVCSWFGLQVCNITRHRHYGVFGERVVIYA